MKKIVIKGGAIEYIPTEEELVSKDKFKAKKKASDLTDSDIKELVFKLAKKANLL